MVNMQRIERIYKVQQWINQGLLESMVPSFFIAVGKMEEQEYLDFLSSPVTEEATCAMTAPWMKEIRPDQPEHKIAIFLENAVQDGEIEAGDYASLADTYGTMNPREFLRTLGRIKDANESQNNAA
jgi:hypothetical protein